MCIQTLLTMVLLMQLLPLRCCSRSPATHARLGTTSRRHRQRMQHLLPVLVSSSVGRDPVHLLAMPQPRTSGSVYHSHRLLIRLRVGWETSSQPKPFAVRSCAGFAKPSNPNLPSPKACFWKTLHAFGMGVCYFKYGRFSHNLESSVAVKRLFS